MSRSRYLPVLASVCAAFALGSPAVTKVEPPNWWPNHSIDPVRLLLHGSELTGATVSPSPGFSASRVWVNASGTYLFFDLTIPAGAKPGSYPLAIRTSTGQTTAPFDLKAPLGPEGPVSGVLVRRRHLSCDAGPLSPMAIPLTMTPLFRAVCSIEASRVFTMAAISKESSIIFRISNRWGLPLSG